MDTERNFSSRGWRLAATVATVISAALCLGTAVIGTSACGEDPNARNWYVYQRADGICLVQYGGAPNVGGQVVWTPIYGPGTQAQANAYDSANCH